MFNLFKKEISPKEKYEKILQETIDKYIDEGKYKLEIVKVEKSEFEKATENSLYAGYISSGYTRREHLTSSGYYNQLQIILDDNLGTILETETNDANFLYVNGEVFKAYKGGIPKKIEERLHNDYLEYTKRIEKERQIKEDEEYNEKIAKLLKLKPLDEELKESFKNTTRVVEIEKEILKLTAELYKIRTKYGKHKILNLLTN